VNSLSRRRSLLTTALVAALLPGHRVRGVPDLRPPDVGSRPDGVASSPTRAVSSWMVETAPLAAALALLCGKLIYFSALLPGAWWESEERIRQWMRPAFHLLDVLPNHPQVLAATLAGLLIVVAPLPWLPRFPRLLGLLAIDAALTSLALVDLVHVRFYGEVLSLSDLIVAPVVVAVLPRILESVPIVNAVYYLDVLAGLLLVPWYWRACRRVPRLDRRSRAGLSTALLGAGVLLAAPVAGLVWRSARELLEHSSARIEVASAIGILPYHVGDLVVRLHRAPPAIGEAEQQLVGRFLEERIRARGTPSPLFGRALGRNLIMVNAESLQAFPLGLEIDGQPVTPRLSAFGRESLHFVNFYDQTHLGTTSDAEFAVLQSLHPLAAGVLSNHFHHHRFRGLPQVLAERGYATLSACAAPGGFWNMASMHPALGFQRSFFEGAYRMVEHVGLWLSDREFFAQTVPRLRAQPIPFMAFLLTASNHHPYRLPAADKVLSLGAREGTLLGDYLHSVHYFDRAFGEFVDRLREGGLLDTSVIVVYGDHQGFLGDPPELAQLLGFPERDEYRTVRVRKNVPLLIRLPQAEAAGVRTASGGHLDIAPTVLSLLGVRHRGSVMLGHDLTHGRHSLVAFRDGSFTDGTIWYVHRGSGAEGVCYEVATGRAVGCGAVEHARREVRERLKVSDLIVRGDLIPILSRPGRRF
jgi:lipoteichoic acid synthase